MILYVSHLNKFKLKYSAKEESKHYRTILVIERLFISSRKHFLLNNSFDSTIWYAEIETEFLCLLKTDLNSLEFLNSLLSIYKRLFVRSMHYQRPEHEVRTIPIKGSRNFI